MNGSEESVQIRRMAAADVDRVLAIAASLPDAPQWPQKVYLDALSPESTPRRIALVAIGVEPEPVQGFTVANLLLSRAELETIAIAAESQRRGLGRRLFDALAAELRASGICEVWLEVRVSNHGALSFYRSLGFGKTGIRPRYYVDPIEDAVLMRLKLV